LMIASGNVGKHLDERADNVNLFVSTNGGTSWTEVRQGLYVPEIGDHGCIIALADIKEKTNELIYTVNNPEDLHEWRSCFFGGENDKIIAKNIRVSDGWDSRRFLLYGQRRNATTGALSAVVIHVNFDNEFSGQCTDSDFEAWTPKNEHGECVMGRSTTYHRRAKGKTCYLSENHQGKTDVTNCECQLEDYECAHCFFRPDLGSECQLQCIVPNLPRDPALCVNSTVEHPLYFRVDNLGYRLVDNDTCDKNRPNAQTPMAKIPCQIHYPPNPLQPSTIVAVATSPWSAIIIVVVILVGAVSGLWYLWKNNPSFYNCVSYTFGIDDGRDARYQSVAPTEPGESLVELHESEDNSLADKQ